jgi:hypothetical protein
VQDHPRKAQEEGAESQVGTQNRSLVDETKGIENPFSLLAEWWILGHDEGVDGAVFARE